MNRRPPRRRRPTMREIERQAWATHDRPLRVLPASWFEPGLAADMKLHVDRNAAGFVRQKAALR